MDVDSLTGTLPFTWTLPGTKTITVMVENAGGAATGTRDIVIAANIYLPLVLKN